MANNNNLFNAVIAGAGGGNQQRWITDTNTSNYTAYQTVIEELAIAIDAAIPPINGDANVAQSALMQSIVASIFADRFIKTTEEANYTPIIDAIIALYTSLASSLLTPTEPIPPDPPAVGILTENNDWDGIEPLFLEIFPPNHTPGQYIVTLSIYNYVTTTGVIAGTLYWKQPGPEENSEFVFGAADVSDGIELLFSATCAVRSDGTLPITWGGIATDVTDPISTLISLTCALEGAAS